MWEAAVVDDAGNAYATGQTQSADFPTTSGVVFAKSQGKQEVFVTKLNAAGSGLVYSTYLGGNGDDRGFGIALHESSTEGITAYVTGRTDSNSFPTTPDAKLTAPQGGIDAFVTRLNGDGTDLIYSTYVGGSGDDAGRRWRCDTKRPHRQRRRTHRWCAAVRRGIDQNAN